MDLGTSFVAIVQLIAEFMNQQRAGTTQSYEEFTAWLADNRHDELLRLLEQNATTSTSIKALLSQNRATVLERFDRLDRILATIARNTEGFRELAAAVRPEARLSEHAIDFLRAFERSGSGEIMEFVVTTGRMLLPTEGGPQIDYGDWRFFEDDMLTLVEAGLLRLKYNPDGKRVFILTRQALDFLGSLRSNRPDRPG